MQVLVRGRVPLTLSWGMAAHLIGGGAPIVFPINRPDDLASELFGTGSSMPEEGGGQCGARRASCGREKGKAQKLRGQVGSRPPRRRVFRFPLARFVPRSLPGPTSRPGPAAA